MSIESAEADSTLRQTASAGPAGAAFGAILGGLAALSCCVAPLIFVIVGISGTWIAHLTALSPYQPIFIAIAVVSIAYGHFASYRSRRSCADGDICAQPLPRRLIDIGLWVGTLFVAIALAVNFFTPYFL